MTNRIRRGVGMVAALLALSVGLAACGSDDGGDDAASGDKKITLGIIPSWTDGLSIGYLWKEILTQEGYDVEVQDIADAAPLYTGVARGDIDIYPSAWSEVTHEAYMEQYGDDLEDLGAYYDGASLTFAVPQYSKITSIADLPDFADELDGKIIGIEAGAGLTKATKEQVIPTYDLGDDFQLVESSTTAMLAELQKAIREEREIVVTLWRPFWANAQFDVKDLEDPEGALGESEALHAIATKGFSDEHPEVADMVGNFKLDDETYGSLEKSVVDAYDENQEAGVEEAIKTWVEENSDFVENLKN